MSSLNFVDPPTKETLVNTRRSLEVTRASVEEITSKIDVAEITLAQLIRDSRLAINELEGQRTTLEDQVSKMLAYLSPIRRLPMELLREIFVWSFEEHACSAWVLAAVCPSWRRLALRIPLIWSKIRLLTTQHSSADTIRLWLERSGENVPLDIEIFLRVTRTGSEVPSACPGRTASPLLAPITPPWSTSLPHQHGTPHYMIPHAPPPQSVANVTIVMPPSPPSHQDGWSMGGHPFHGNDRSTNMVSRSSMHWGHIAFFYLVEQMHRWERFIFRFDKQFTSMGALKAINGDAPLLKEFEVSSAEAGFFAEWPWLPNSNTANVITLPKLRTLRLQHTPFKWSSPMLRDLHTLNLRALPTSHLPLDRILFILSNNPNLKNVAFHFQGVLPAILPLSGLTLPHVVSLSLGGHYLLTHLLDSLTLPNLSELTLDIEARDAIEDIISSLIARSSRPPIKLLSVAFGVAANAATFYYGPGGIVITWTDLLTELPHLTTLNIGGTSLEPLLTALGPPDDDPHQSQNPTWVCPALESLGMRSCHAHGEGMTRLVQMIDARNPESGPGQGVGGVTPVRLERLELLECVSFGEDVMRWLEAKIPKVICKDPLHDRSSLPNSYL